MGRERTKQTFKLQLLALVLAFAIIWYSLNPAPRPVARTKRENEVPDEKKREAEPQLQGAAALPVLFGTLGAGIADEALPHQEEDDFDWPDLIDA
ncbi:MAG TPA: hypothetical protein VF708_17940 [Pyrinomonadaceae bacterium]|jgi:hypothetical protein